MSNTIRFRPAERNGKRFRTAAGTETPGNLFFVSATSAPLQQAHGRADRKVILRHWFGTSCTLRSGKVTQFKEHQGADSQSLWETLRSVEQQNKPLWVFGYDLAKTLTLCHFWSALERREFELGPIEPGKCGGRLNNRRTWKGTLCLEGSPVYAVVLGSKGKVIFCDCLNYVPTGIDSLAAAVGLTLSERPSDDAEPGEWLRYGREFANIVQRSMVKFLLSWRAIDGGPWAKTIAGLALSSFRRYANVANKEGTQVNLILSRHQEAEQIELEGYFGGRTEPFFLGKQHGLFFKLDVNSLFPSVMKEYAFPVARRGIVTGIKPPELWREMANYGAIACVDVCSDDATYPLKLNGLLTYARGRFTTTLCGVELFSALENGHIRKVHYAVTYKQERYFSSWVDKWYSLKSECDNTSSHDACSRLTAKMVLNSLYGKFAQRSKRWATIPGGPVRGEPYSSWVELLKSGRRINCRAIAGIRQELQEGEPPQHYFPAVSACITAAARHKMNSVLALLPKRSCYYLGVDMVIVDESGYEALAQRGLLDEKALGKFKLQGVADSIEIVSPNWYRFGDQWVRSGGWGCVQQLPDGAHVYEASDRLPSILTKQPDGTLTVRVRPLGEHERWAKGYVDQYGYVNPYKIEAIRE